MTRGRRGTKKVGHNARPTHACVHCTRWRFELSAFLAVCRRLQLVQLWCASPKIMASFEIELRDARCPRKWLVVDRI